MSAVPHPPIAPRSGAGAARQARVRRIRRRVVAWAVIAFVALWGAVYVQMRSGADPALGAGTKAAVVTKAATTSGAPTASHTASAHDDANASSPAPVTTSQS
jgi:hypothetical protein